MIPKQGCNKPRSDCTIYHHHQPSQLLADLINLILIEILFPSELETYFLTRKLILQKNNFVNIYFVNAGPVVNPGVLSAVIILLLLVVCLVGWTGYAYFNPQTTSGQLLIQVAHIVSVFLRKLSPQLGCNGYQTCRISVLIFISCLICALYLIFTYISL